MEGRIRKGRGRKGSEKKGREKEGEMRRGPRFTFLVTPLVGANSALLHSDNGWR